jgi:secondary thiamine-phosphate synthase enzyme
MVYSESIKVKIKSQEFFDLTGKVEEIVRSAEADEDIENGICNVFVVGSTAAVIINENHPMLLEDFRRTLEKISGSKEIYQHVENAYSHIRSMMIGSSQSIPIKDGEMMLGTWQNIMIANFDTQEREREIIVTVIGD